MKNRRNYKKVTAPTVTVEAKAGMPVRFQSYSHISQCYEQALGEVKEVLADGRVLVKYYGMTLLSAIRPCDVLEALKAKPYWA